MATHSSIVAWRIPGTGAWWAVVYGVAQSRTRLKRLTLLSPSPPAPNPSQHQSLFTLLLLLLLSHFSHVQLCATP